MRLSDMIRDRRNEFGMSQADLARRIDMSPEWVNKIESGQIRASRPAPLRRVADVLQLDSIELMIAAELARTRSEAERIDRAVPADEEAQGTMARVTELLTELDEDARRDFLADLQATVRVYRRARRHAPDVEQPNPGGGVPRTAT